MAGSESNGVDVYVSWHLIEWALTMGWAMGSGMALWVWNLGGKVGRLEDELAYANETIRDLKDETNMMKRMLRQVGSALDTKIQDTSHELEGKIDSMRDRLEGIREELPSRNFIEGQFSNLTQRIDRAVEGRPRAVG